MITSYYKKDWGFCIKHSQKKKIINFYKSEDLFKILKNFNYKIYDNNLKEPKKLRSLEYLILPEKVNPRKFLNVN